MVRSINHDLALGAGGGLMVLSGIDAVRQRVIERLRYHVGEWYLDLADGVPYRDGDDPILSHIQGPELAASRLASHVEGIVYGIVDGPVSVVAQEVRLDRATRRLQCTLVIQIPEGETVVEVT